MADREETLTLKVKLEGAQTVQELEEVLVEINEELEKLEEGSEAFEELTSVAEDATKELDEVNESMVKINGQTSLLESGMEGLNSVTEMFGVSTGKLSSSLKSAHKQLIGLSGGMRAAATATGKTSAAMKIFRLALISTGIGALIIAVASLLSFFTRTQKGVDLVSKAMAGLGAVVDVIIDRFSKVGEGLLALFSGNFADAADIFSDAVSGITAEIKAEANAAIELEAALQALEDREISLIETQEKRRTEIARLQLEVEKQAEFPIKAAALLRQSIKLENEIANENIDIAKERARIINAQLALGESTRDQIREAAEANADIIALEGERNMKLRELEGRLRSFTVAQRLATDAMNKQFEASEKLLRDTDITEEEEALLDDVDAEMEALINRNQQLFDAQVRENKLNEEEAERHALAMVDWEIFTAEKTKEIEESSAEVRKQLALGLYSDLIVLANSFFADTEEGQKKAFAFNKAVQIAETIVSTFSAAQKAFASQIIPGDPTSIIRGQIAAGLAIAGGLARVAAIQNTKFDSKTVQNTSQSTPSIDGNRDFTPSTSTLVDTELGIRETKIFVTETDITRTIQSVDIITQKATVVQ